MSRCPPATVLRRFLFDEMDPAITDTIGAHLATCADCQDSADQLSSDESLIERFHLVQEKRTRVQELDAWREYVQAWSRVNEVGESTSEVVGQANLVRFTDIPKQLGRFEIKAELGRGGFGVVYLAHDPELQRLVALKVPHPQRVRRSDLHARFLREARTVAALNHPRIVTIYEFGEIEGQLYLVTAYCAGGTLADYLHRRDKPLSFREAATLVALLAEATHYAHDCHVLHRDLKPANVLLDTNETNDWRGQDSLPFVPRLADFGLARWHCFDSVVCQEPAQESTADSLNVTQAGTVVGTPAYMAPEQVTGDARRIGRTTDVYSLGAVLYELLTGQTPFTAATRAELLQMVRSDVPVSPRRRRPSVPRDLEAICLKCLEKQPQQRYATAALLATDLRRYLNGEPTSARRLNSCQRLVRWTIRRPAEAAFVAVFALSLVGLLGGLVFHNLRLSAYATALNESLGRENERAREVTRQRDLAQEGELAARRQAYLSHIWQVGAMWRAGQGFLVAEALNRVRPHQGEQDGRGFEWHYLWGLGRNLTELHGGLGTTYGVEFSPSAKHCVSWHGTSRDMRLNVWHLPTCTLLREWKTPGVAAAVFEDEQHIVTAKNGSIQWWEAATGRLLDEKPGPQANTMRLSPDGRWLAFTEPSDKPRKFQIWNIRQQACRPLSGRILCGYWEVMSFSADSKLVAVGRHLEGQGDTASSGDASSSAEEICVVDVVTGNITHRFMTTSGPLISLGFSADGKVLIAGKHDGQMEIFPFDDATRAEPITTSSSSALARISPDGKTIATGFGKEWRGQLPPDLQIIDRANKTVLGNFGTRGEWVESLAFSPQGDVLAYGGTGGMLRLAKLRPRPEYRRWKTGHGETWAVAFSANGKALVTAGDDGLARRWDVQTGAQNAVFNGHQSLVTATRVLPDGCTLATASFDQTVRLWNMATGEQQAHLVGPDDGLRALAVQSNGSRLAAAGNDRKVYVWRLEDKTLQHVFAIHQDKIRSLQFHPHEPWLISADNDGRTVIHNLETGEVVRQWRVAYQTAAIAITPDGQWLIVGTNLGQIQMISTDDIETSVLLNGHVGEVRALAISPDGRTLASGGADRTVKLWQVSTGQEFFSLRGTEAKINGLAFSPDNACLAAACHDGSVVVWDAKRESVD